MRAMHHFYKQESCTAGKEICCHIWLSVALALKVVCVCVADSQPSIQTRAGGPCLETLSVTPLLSGPGQLVPVTGCCREVEESGMAPQGPWVARGEAALLCQSLSPEVPEPRGVRHFLAKQELWSCRQQLQNLPAFATPAPALSMARLCIWLLSDTQQENWSLHASTNMLTHACGRARAATHLTQPCAGRDASLGSPQDLHRFARKSGGGGGSCRPCSVPGVSPWLSLLSVLWTAEWRRWPWEVEEEDGSEPR